MIAPDDCCEPDSEGYEPDSEDIALQLARERKFEDTLSYIGESERQLRDYHKPTDKPLRDISKEAKSLSRELWNEYQFDVASDSFEVDLDGKTSITVPRHGLPREEVPRSLTRTDKRRMKKDRRKRKRQLGILMKRGCSPRQVTGYEDTSFTTVVAAA
jgi:hypothetical protein